MAVFFAIAWWGDRLADKGRVVVGSPIVYTLSLSVYCTAWTFYGSVGLASTNGLAFLPTYLGPTLAAIVFPFVLHKMLRVSKANGINSIADLISSRYGKSPLLAGIVTIVALVGATPYLALQIQALSASIGTVAGLSDEVQPDRVLAALSVTAALALFSILFGTRNIDATANHQGLILAIAGEGIIKLGAFLTIGGLVTFGMYDGFLDLMAKAALAGFERHMTLSGTGFGYADWFLLTLLSAGAIIVLPRQFQVAVIENVDERHLRTASWMFPAYLMLINLFVLPLALAGLMAGHDPGDMLVLKLAIDWDNPWLLMLTYLGGLSAAMAMIVVTNVALSTMVSNDLILPILLKYNLFRARERSHIGALILNIRRLAIAIMMLAGFLFAIGLAGRFPLVSIGLIAFVGVAQFLPALIAALYWPMANLKGAMCGMLAGIGVWIYTLLLPALSSTGMIDSEFLVNGAFGISFLKPHQLFGSTGYQPAVHSMIWSLALNTGLLVIVSALSSTTALERVQAINFVDAFRGANASVNLWRGDTKVSELAAIVRRFIGRRGLTRILDEDARKRGREVELGEAADADFVQLVERRLASAIGAGSARAAIASVVRGEAIGPEDVMEIIDETSQVVRYSHQLEKESRALAKATVELREANDRLQQLDQMKDDFIATVSHELRTPLTSIRSFSEILRDTEDLGAKDRRRFLGIIVNESERLTRLINDVLDLSKIESGKMEWSIEAHDLGNLLDQAIKSCEALFSERGIELYWQVPDKPVVHHVDEDRLMQVVVNLLSNAAKFVPATGGRVHVRLTQTPTTSSVCVSDNGPGVPTKYRDAIFEKFHQASEDLKGRPKGTGLGLTICRQIIDHFHGRIWVGDSLDGGAAVQFDLPRERLVSR